MAPTSTEIHERLQNILSTGLSQPLNPDQISSGTALTEGGLELDSITLLELVVSIENEFDILLDDGSLALEHFASLEALAKVILGKLEQKSTTTKGA